MGKARRSCEFLGTKCRRHNLVAGYRMHGVPPSIRWNNGLGIPPVLRPFLLILF